jgi:hypothetical protein
MSKLSFPGVIFLHVITTYFNNYKKINNIPGEERVFPLINYEPVQDLDCLLIVLFDAMSFRETVRFLYCDHLHKVSFFTRNQ